MKFCHVTNKAKTDDVSASRGVTPLQEEDDDENAVALSQYTDLPMAFY